MKRTRIIGVFLGGNSLSVPLMKNSMEGFIIDTNGKKQLKNAADEFLQRTPGRKKER
jgi:hypothetical protein